MLSEISQRKTNTAWYHLHVESKKYNKLVNITIKKPTNRYREQTCAYQWEDRGGRGNIWVGELEVQTIRYQISYKCFCTIQRIQPIFHNNYKWSITFKNWITIIYICNLYNIIQQLYFNLKTESGTSLEVSPGFHCCGWGFNPDPGIRSHSPCIVQGSVPWGCSSDILASVTISSPRSIYSQAV